MSAAEQLQLQLPQGYDNTQDLDVQAVLRLHHDLYNVLTEGRAKVTEYFGENAAIRLKVEHFPEGFWHLYAVVTLPGMPSDALIAADDRFLAEWCVSNDQLMRAPLTFTIGSDQ